MNRIQKIKIPFVLLAILLFLGISKSQAQCIDIYSVCPTCPCPDLLYKPICGCDGNTYRNLCYFERAGGNRAPGSTYTEGTCSGFELDVFPLIVAEDQNLTITFAQASEKYATFMLVDAWGKIYIQRTLPAQKLFEFQLAELPMLSRGPYIALIYNSEGKYKYVKFLKL
jgi:hypothetical protein